MEAQVDRKEGFARNTTFWFSDVEQTQNPATLHSPQNKASWKEESYLFVLVIAFFFLQSQT